MNTTPRKTMRVLNRALSGTLLWLALGLGVRVAKATEIVPAIGMTKPVDGAADAKMFGSLAIRGGLLPLLKSEIGVAYRSESRFDERLHVRMWPVTASLYLAPLPMLYAGAGVGWYQITYDYDQSKIPFAVSDETKQEFGVHLGGGMTLPVTPSVGIDLNGRYVMMRDQRSRLVPEKFSPDFWTSSLGLALKF